MARPDLSRLSQETLAILGVGIALAALILTSIASVRGEIQTVRDELRTEIRTVRTEARADREAMRAEARADREAMRAEARADREAMRAEARADREALREEMRAEHETFRNLILRLTEQQGILRARLDGFSDPPATSRQAAER